MSFWRREYQVAFIYEPPLLPPHWAMVMLAAIRSPNIWWEAYDTKAVVQKRVELPDNPHQLTVVVYLRRRMPQWLRLLFWRFKVAV